MGHRDTSAQFHEADCFCSDGGGVARAAAEPSPVKVPVLKVAPPKATAASRGAIWLLIAAIRFYQAVFAPLMPLGCKFYPSCSRYAAAQHAPAAPSRAAAPIAQPNQPVVASSTGATSAAPASASGEKNVVIESDLYRV